MTNFSGLGVAMVTPFMHDADQNRLVPDFTALDRLTDFLIDGKVDYLVVLGTTGETATLSQEEQDEVIRRVMARNAGRLPVVLGAGGNDTAKVAHIMQDYVARFQPSGFLSVSPYYNKPTQKGIFEHFKFLSQSTDLPIILYNVPGRTASNVLPETILKLAHSFSNIVAVKEASGSLEQGMEIIKGRPEGFQVLSGDDILGLPSVASGYDGVISVVGNSLPGHYSKLVHAALEGDFATAKALHYQLQHIMQLNFSEGNPAGVKAALELLKLCTAKVRLPLIEASPELKAKMGEELKALSLL